MGRRKRGILLHQRIAQSTIAMRARPTVGPSGQTGLMGPHCRHAVCHAWQYIAAHALQATQQLDCRPSGPPQAQAPLGSSPVAIGARVWAPGAEVWIGSSETRVLHSRDIRALGHHLDRPGFPGKKEPRTRIKGGGQGSQKMHCTGCLADPVTPPAPANQEPGERHQQVFESISQAGSWDATPASSAACVSVALRTLSGLPCSSDSFSKMAF